MGANALRASLEALLNEKNGGSGRNRTGVDGFAIRCITTLPPSQVGASISASEVEPKPEGAQYTRPTRQAKPPKFRPNIGLFRRLASAALRPLAFYLPRGAMDSCPHTKVKTMFENLTTDIQGAIGRLTLNRPEKLNALSRQTLAEIAQAAAWFNTQSEVKVVIVSGNGRAFSAGADLESFSGDTEQHIRAAADQGRLMAEAVEGMQAVTIAAIQGWCVGGGLVLSAACDLRVACNDARFSIPEVDLGIPLAWGGIPRLVREIGPALTKELVLTCRPFGASEARACGFLNRVVDSDALESETQTLAALIAKKASHAIASTKQHVNAVTAQMVGTTRSWADADGLVVALHDTECNTARAQYLATKSN